MIDHQKLLSVREAAERLALRESTIRAWLLFRKLPKIKVGRAVRIPEEAISRLIEENTTPARERWRA
jgi:excisionase family DNA binding protein